MKHIFLSAILIGCSLLTMEIPREHVVQNLAKNRNGGVYMKMGSDNTNEDIWNKIINDFYSDNIDPNFDLKVTAYHEDGHNIPVIYNNIEGKTKVQFDIRQEFNNPFGPEYLIKDENGTYFIDKSKLFYLYMIRYKQYTSQSLVKIISGEETLTQNIIKYSWADTPGVGAMISDDQCQKFFSIASPYGPNMPNLLYLDTYNTRYMMDGSFEDYIARDRTQLLLLNSGLDLKAAKVYAVMDLIMPHSLAYLFSDGTHEYLLFPVNVTLAPRNYVNEEDYFEYTFHSDQIYTVQDALQKLSQMYVGYERSDRDYWNDSEYWKKQEKK